MYTRSRQNQGYGNARNANNSQIQGSYTMPYDTQGSYQASQSTSNQQSNYKQGNIQNSQGFKSQPQQQQQLQQQQPAQMPPAAVTRPLSTMVPTQQLKSQMQQQGQQQMLQQQPPPQQQIQQQPQQQLQQQQANPAPLPQRLKPILKQSTANVQPTTTVAQITPVTSQPCVPPVVSAPTLFSDPTNNNSDVNDDSIKTEDGDIEMQDVQPRWRRKIPGFKVNKKLKRLRMNQRLRKTLQPKNAIMVLNEMKAGVQFTFPETQGPMTNSLYLVHAELDGKTYVGQGLSKPLARQNAAENALKALLLEKMTAASMKARIDAESDGQANSSSDGIKEEMNEDSNTMDTSTEDEIPWSSLASFALYKLFLEWHNQGTSVPVPRPGLPATKGAKKDNPNAPKTPVQKELPPNPVNIHPVMLLNQMKPGLTYVELSRVGNPPNTMFTLAVEIDGIEYSGTAKNKKDAKKAAAKAALLALYNLTYPEDIAKQENMVVG
ncbi:double-stranded RNA-specific editase Adar-like isoform X1 [Cataglyphis hispanica]|uniref:double-stranded RNA-specific editase Adar-like isoform X1 n=2 Tax=Cataglyphis hispanica TaxID=1086592 RepID=UPI00217F3D14|nr:double-stranded RNA-specific editase Adar-like isoform X1 [Cataglyphis hispanica]